MTNFENNAISLTNSDAKFSLKPLKTIVLSTDADILASLSLKASYEA